MVRERKPTERIKFTKKTIEALEIPEANRVEYRDEHERYLRLVVSPEGRRSWRYVRKVAGRTRKITLGTYPGMTPAQARKASSRVSMQYDAGEDPAAAKKAQRGIPTWAQLFAWYIDEHARKHKRSYKYDIKMEAMYCKQWRSRRHSDITPAMVSTWHKNIGATRGKHAADRVLAMIKTVYAIALKLEFITGRNPATPVGKFYTNPSLYGRTRYLDGDEIGRLLVALNEYHDRDMADFFTVALFTGARRGNVQSMRWDDLSQDDPSTAKWTIPGEDSKNKTDVEIQIVEPVISVLNRRHNNRRSDTWVFPSPKKANAHITEPKKAWTAICRQAKLKDVRIHDLRRTLGSWQASLGASLQIIGKSLGHRSMQSTEVYSRINYDPVRKSIEAATAAMLNTAKN